MPSSQASNDQGSEAPANLSYKERLDEAAEKARYPNQESIQNKPGVVTQVVEKGESRLSFPFPPLSLKRRRQRLTSMTIPSCAIRPRS